MARARRGLAFERFFAATSSTQPTHASLFTGLHPWQHGVTRNGMTLGEEQTTVAEALRAAGFATGAVVGAFPVARRFGFGQGFDVFDEELTEGQPPPAWEGQADAEERYYRLAERVTRAAIAQLDDAGRATKQFYWFHYFDAHGPYGDTGKGPALRPQDLLELAQTGADVREQVVRARELYDEDARSLDGWLERLFERLEKDAAAFDTHVVVTADHGESFGEDGSLAHGRRVTAGQIHVPLFILSPRAGAGLRRDVAGSVDVPRTLYRLAGIAVEAPGRDLLVPVDGGVAFGMRRRFAQHAAREAARWPGAPARHRPVLRGWRRWPYPCRQPRRDPARGGERRTGGGRALAADPVRSVRAASRGRRAARLARSRGRAGAQGAGLRGIAPARRA